MSNFHRLNDLLVHSCNKVLRALLAAVIERERPSGARTIDELIQIDQGNIASKRIVQQNKDRVFTNNIVIIECWDLQLLCFFIKYVCPPNDGICNDIDALRKNRNDLCHTSNGLIDDAYYQLIRDEIKAITSKFLGIIGNATFKEETENEIVEIDNGTRSIPKAVDTLREWLKKEKDQRLPIDTFSDERQEILHCLLRAYKRREFAHLCVPDAEFDIVVENAGTIQQQNQVSETLVNILDERLRANPQLFNVTEVQFAAIRDQTREVMVNLLPPGQTIIRATHGCVIITIRSNTFESLSDLWRKLVSAETEVIMAPLQEILRKTFSEHITIKVILPECSFLDVAEKIIQQMKEINQDGSHEGPDKRTKIPEIEELNVQEQQLTVSKPVVNLKFKPKSLRDYERLHRQLSEGILDTTFEKITDVLRKELNAPKLIISVIPKTYALSAKQKNPDVAFTCFNGTTLQLIREDVGAALKEALVVETTESFDFKSTEVGKALINACGEQIVKRCHDKYPKGLQAWEIAEIDGQKLLEGTRLLLTCLPEYSEENTNIMKQTYHKCLLTAVHLKMDSIAFTAAGTSNAKYPVDVVAATLTETCISFDKEKQLGSVKVIAFVVSPADEPGYIAFQKALQQIPSQLEIKPPDSEGDDMKQELTTGDIEIMKQIYGTKVYGVPLKYLVGKDEKVPQFMDNLISLIETHGLFTVGIYMKPGSVHKVKMLKLALDSGLTDINIEEYPVHVLTNTLRAFLRDLPEPLLTFKLYDEFIQAAEIHDEKEAVQVLYTLIERVPHVNHNVLGRLISHLARVASKESTNKMSVHRLSTIFAPCLLRTNQKTPAQDMVIQMDRKHRVVQKILQEQLRKVLATLRDISTLESAEITASERSNVVRTSMRNISPVSPTAPKRSESDEDLVEQERVISSHIRSPKEERDNLTSTMPQLEYRHSSDDESSYDTADDMEYSYDKKKHPLSTFKVSPTAPKISESDEDLVGQDRVISLHRRSLKEERDNLTSAMPQLEFPHSSDDVMLSRVDVESTYDTADDMEYSHDEQTPPTFQSEHNIDRPAIRRPMMGLPAFMNRSGRNQTDRHNDPNPTLDQQSESKNRQWGKPCRPRAFSFLSEHGEHNIDRPAIRLAVPRPPAPMIRSGRNQTDRHNDPNPTLDQQSESKIGSGGNRAVRGRSRSHQEMIRTTLQPAACLVEEPIVGDTCLTHSSDSTVE